MNPFELLAESPLWDQPPLAIVASLVVTVAFVLVAVAIVIDFARYYRQPRKVVGGDRSLVETGSMTAFFLAYYLVIRLRWLEVPVGGVARTTMVVAGLVLIVVGVAVNISGRLVLKSSWANQIRVYEGQTLITTGPYALVRHPLYASLIWIFVGGSLVYANPLSLLLTAAVFVPMMYVRASKEDAVLAETFGEEFERYRGRTGMLFPRAWRSSWRT